MVQPKLLLLVSDSIDIDERLLDVTIRSRRFRHVADKVDRLPRDLARRILDAQLQFGRPVDVESSARTGAASRTRQQRHPSMPQGVVLGRAQGSAIDEGSAVVLVEYRIRRIVSVGALDQNRAVIGVVRVVGKVDGAVDDDLQVIGSMLRLHRTGIIRLSELIVRSGSKGHRVPRISVQRQHHRAGIASARSSASAITCNHIAIHTAGNDAVPRDRIERISHAVVGMVLVQIDTCWISAAQNNRCRLHKRPSHPGPQRNGQRQQAKQFQFLVQPEFLLPNSNPPCGPRAPRSALLRGCIPTFSARPPSFPKMRGNAADKICCFLLSLPSGSPRPRPTTAQCNVPLPTASEKTAAPPFG